MVIELLAITIGIGSPWGVGFLLCKGMLPQINSTLTVGLGYFVGIILVPLGLLAEDKLTGSVSVAGPGVLLAIAALLVVLTHANRSNQWFLPNLGKPALVVLKWSMLPLVVLMPAVVDVALRPLFPWDAWYTFAVQAKIHFHFREVAEFTLQSAWIDERSDGSFPAYAAHGPFVPLIQTWAALLIDRWSESLINLFWPIAWLSIALVTAGSIREANYDKWLSALTGAAVLLVPFAGVHATLAGYADLWLAGFALATAISLKNARQSENRIGWLSVAIITMLGAVLTKKFGLAVVVLICLAWLCALPQGRVQKWFGAAMLLGSIAGVVYIKIGVPWNLGIDSRFTGKVGIIDGAIRIPGVPILRVADGRNNSAALFDSAFFSPNFGIAMWICVGLVLFSVRNFATNFTSRFAIYWVILISFALWLVYSHTVSYEDVYYGATRILLVVLVVAYPLLVHGSGKGCDPQLR